MEKKKEPSPFSILWKWAEKYHSGFYGAIATATYHTLRDLREQMLKKLSRMPMGVILDTPSGQFKTTLVDRVEGMEPTLAHLIPEMTANLVVPIAIAVYIFALDWRMGLSSKYMTVMQSFIPSILLFILPVGGVLYGNGSLSAADFFTIIVLSLGFTGPFLAAMSFVDELAVVGTNVGDITAVVTTTLSDVENNASRCLVIIIGGFLNTFALTLGVLVVEWRIGLIALAGIVVYLVVTELSTKASSATGPKRQEAQAHLVEAVLEYIQGMSVVKSYGLEKDNNQTVLKNVRESCDKALALTRTVAPWMAIRQLVIRVFAVLILIASLVFYRDGSMTLPMCILMLIVSFMIYQELEGAGNMSDNLQMLGASMDKADEIDKTPVMDIDGKDLTAKDGEVVFDDVSFAYSEDTRKILDHVSITIPAKTTTAVVGPSGGKTTMCSLIARFWDVNGGKITIGGTDMKDYKLDSLMKHISMVFQDVYLFQDTIENNLKFGKPDATHEEVVKAAKAACCHEFIEVLPDGYETVLGEGGGTLSGGEKQRISERRRQAGNWHRPFAEEYRSYSSAFFYGKMRYNGYR